jgi:ADP-L-glycero-D-manno-heptose 6-epimerase
MIIVVGANGFIGSNVFESISKNYKCNVIPVDRKTTFYNRNYLSKNDIQRLVFSENLFEYLYEHHGEIRNVVVMSGNSNTLETDLENLYEENYRYPKKIIEICVELNIDIIYASSASIYKYQETTTVREELPSNEYAKSKYALDSYVVNNVLESGKIYGLRFFNVYGRNEDHKGKMSSMIKKLTEQYINSGYMTLFSGAKGYDCGEQKRDFVSVDRVCDVILYFLTQDRPSGIFDVGTGVPITFNSIASLVYEVFHGKKAGTIKNNDLIDKGALKYISMPRNIEISYQSYTCANINYDYGFQISYDECISELKKYIELVIKKNIAIEMQSEKYATSLVCHQSIVN